MIYILFISNATGRQEKDDLDAKLAKLSKRTEEVKVKVYNALQEKYVDFYPNLNTAEELTGKVKTTLDEMQQVAEQVDKEVSGQSKNGWTCPVSQVVKSTLVSCYVMIPSEPFLFIVQASELGAMLNTHLYERPSFLAYVTTCLMLGVVSRKRWTTSCGSICFMCGFLT